MASSRKADSSAKKMSKLYVEPAELARKLIKELEDSKVSRGGQPWAPDQYTVFLCREDYTRFRGHIDQLTVKLQDHVEKHVMSRRYATSGPISVELTLDPDLKPGYFGVLAERGGSSAGRQGGSPAPGGRSVWDVPEDLEEAYEEDGAYREAAYERAPGGDPYASRPPVAPPMPRSPSVGTSIPVPPMPAGAPPMPAAAPPMPAAAPPLGPSYARPLGGPPSLDRATPQQPGYPAQPQPQAAPAGLPRGGGAGSASAGPAGEPIVLKVNGQVHEFPQGKVVIGRSHDVDLRIDHADVSRRHAMIYWSDGSIVVRDLGSTNGTMVNGYPIESTVVRPTDTIRIGNYNITAEPR
jgi:hypothetical protein